MQVDWAHVAGCVHSASWFLHRDLAAEVWPKCHVPGSQLLSVTPADTFGAKDIRLPVYGSFHYRRESVLLSFVCSNG